MQRMPLLLCSSKLPTLQRVLTQCYPESLKVCGALHNIINENPFKLQVLVDQWPNFTSVVCRPRLEDMTDPTDQYTNTYFMYSKDQQMLSDMLQDPQTINWSHKIQIQGCQPALGEVLRDVSAKYKSSIKTTSNILYTRESIQSTEEADLLSTLSQGELQFSFLSLNEASAVNENWMFGGNKHSLRYVERCIQNLPTVCIREKYGGRPVTWAVCDQTSELRMGYTLPTYRNHGLSYTMLVTLAELAQKRGAPIFCHTTPENIASQRVILRAKFKQVGRWMLWNINPFMEKL
ncbi:glycine N-acyltransferase isoform X2 [Bombina bombina]|uniref:glycine N-acyltransferase isoform X2 n=1 Tax=Bombina bombina TaxID=8345 RepID=UPI00235A81F4|nr:glycine N-acyltransferase isoform X2 [Bombina bombina]